MNTKKSNKPPPPPRPKETEEKRFSTVPLPLKIPQYSPRTQSDQFKTVPLPGTNLRSDTEKYIAEKAAHTPIRSPPTTAVRPHSITRGSPSSNQRVNHGSYPTPAPLTSTLLGLGQWPHAHPVPDVPSPQNRSPSLALKNFKPSTTAADYDEIIRDGLIKELSSHYQKCKWQGAKSCKSLVLDDSALSLVETDLKLGPLELQSISSVAFCKIRSVFSVSAASILSALESPLICKKTPASGGGLFYYTRDKKFVLKTIKSRELRILQNMIGPYLRYIQDYPHTFISRYFGLYRVLLPRLGKEDKLDEMYLLLMNHVFDTELDIHEKYDLKGSTVDRTATYNEKIQGMINGVVFKDCDFHGQIQIGPQLKLIMLMQLESDIQFLHSCKVMDYSVLLGIHHKDTRQCKHHTPSGDTIIQSVTPTRDTVSSKHETTPKSARLMKVIPIKAFQQDINKMHKEQQRSLLVEASNTPPATSPLSAVSSNQNPKSLQPRPTIQLPKPKLGEPFFSIFQKDHGGIRAKNEHNDCLSNNESHYYFMGIIDTLQTYDADKVLETAAKKVILQLGNISSTNPERYAQRLLEYMRKILT